MAACRIPLRAMIVTSMAVMYGVMYVNTFELAHVRWSETRLFMIQLMGSTMAIIMLGFMLSMYKDRWVNIAIVAESLVLPSANRSGSEEAQGQLVGAGYLLKPKGLRHGRHPLRVAVNGEDHFVVEVLKRPADKTATDSLGRDQICQLRADRIVARESDCEMKW
jgi:hypothetical protein